MTVRAVAVAAPAATRQRSARAGFVVERAAVLGLAAVVVGLLVLQGLFVDRPVGIEEIVAYDPAHQFFQEGRVAFPSYGWWYGPRVYDTMGVHPHVQYAAIGALLQAGFGLRAAEALPIIGTATLTVLLVVTSRIAAPVQVGLLFGLAASLALGMQTMPDHVIAVRPEYHAAVAGLAGVVALEAGRVGGWDVRRLFLGAFLLTFASGLQWNSMGGFLGVGVYAAWALWQLGPRAAWPKLLALAAGGLLFGVPYILLFVLPNWDLIMTVQQMGRASNPQGPGVWEENAQNYRGFRDSFAVAARSGGMLFTAGPFALGAWTGLPPFAVGAGLLMISGHSRLIGLALTPMSLYSYFAVTSHKGYYYLPEFVLIGIGFGVATAVIAAAIGSRLAGARGRQAATIGLAVVLGCGVVTGSPRLREVELTLTLMPHPLEVARLAAKQIVGPSALVTSQHQLWFMSGGRHWYDYSRDILGGQWKAPPDELFGHFDAVADVPYWIFSLEALKRERWATPGPALYAEGRLKLRGFYADTKTVAFTVWDSHGTEPVRGYVRRGRSMFQFAANPSGRYAFAALICPIEGDLGLQEMSTYEPGREQDLILLLDISTAFVPFLSHQDLTFKPVPPDAPEPARIRAILTGRDRYQAEAPRLEGRCRVRDLVAGDVAVLDAHEFGRKLRPEDRIVTPFFTLEQALDASQAARGASSVTVAR